MDSRQRKTLEKVFAHPVRHDIRWKDIEHMFDALGAELSEASGGRLKVELKGQEAIFSRPKRKQLESASEVLAIRRFLEITGFTPEALAAAKEAVVSAEGSLHVVVLFTDNEVRIYDLEVDRPDETRVTSPDPSHRRWHLKHRTAVSRITTQQKRAEVRFYKEIAAQLMAAEQVLVLTQVKGQSSGVSGLMKHLAESHPDRLEHVVGMEILDEPTEHRMLAHARKIFQL